MGYLAVPRAMAGREDPGGLLPGCRSILVLAAVYTPPNLERDQTQDLHPVQGRIAAYACGRDYHLVLMEKMEILVAAMQAFAGEPFKYRCYTDTGPILERDLAQRAGLGWVGKNTCLISPRLGSYFFLAEILLGIELETDLPFQADRCGKCQRCLEACPTGCIQPDRSLDAGRCISYLTIEKKGSIPVELRPYVGQWVFGCDLCQVVCPWNRFAERQGDDLFSAITVESRPSLAQALRLSTQEFNRKYKDTPLMRTRRNRYLRNVIVALVNSRRAGSSNETLKQLCDDPDPVVREHARWAVEAGR